MFFILQFGPDDTVQIGKTRKTRSMEFDSQHELWRCDNGIDLNQNGIGFLIFCRLQQFLCFTILQKPHYIIAGFCSFFCFPIILLAVVWFAFSVDC